MPPRRSKSPPTPSPRPHSHGYPQNGRVNGNGTLNRTTIFLPDVLDENLDCLSLQTGESRATIVRLALAQYMLQQGYDPYKKPKITVSHR